MSMLLCFGALGDTLITLGVLALVGVILYALIAHPHARPYLTGLICLVMFVSGVYSVFTAWDYYNTHSTVVGELEVHDPYEDFNFYEYDLQDFSLLREQETNEDGEVISTKFYFETTYATSIEFNGTENTYTLLINDKPCDMTMSNYGKLYGTTTIHFDDVDGTEKEVIELDIDFTFYSSNILLRIETDATQDNASMLEEYFKINGFNLRLIEEINVGDPILSDSVV